MRSRKALITSLFVAALIAASLALPGAAAPRVKEASWAPKHLTDTPTELLTSANLAPMGRFFAQVTEQRFLSALAASQPSSTVTTGTPEVDDAAAWACIELHESGDGRGSADLYGLEPPAWAEYGPKSPSGAPAYTWAGAAPQQVQLSVAILVWQANGDSWAHGAWSTAGVCGLS